MGREIDRTRFTEEDFRAFSAKLHDDLRALSAVLDRPGFGHCRDTLGAELELYITDPSGRALGINRELRRRFGDSRLALELNRYNLEYNFTPLALAGSPFGALETAITELLASLNREANPLGGCVLPIGILPTLSEADLGNQVMTDEPRYRALSDILIAMRGGSFDIAIDGKDPFAMSRADLTAEGICTSFQIHYSFPIERFVDTWNAMVLVTPLVLALSTNSPLLLGHRLWHETRIPLFKQATDGRRHNVPWHDLARVDLANDWLRHTPHELFAQRVYLYPPLIPLCSDESPADELAAGRLPDLHELCLHNGTIWHWNRPIYSAEDGGHIRVEMRSLPAGPTAVDMAANAAFHVGLAVGLRDQVEALLPALPFRYAAQNFYRAAREGPSAKLVWPSLNQNRLWERPVGAIAGSLLDTAQDGLAQLGVSSRDSDRMLTVIEERIASQQSGSSWQLRAFDHFLTAMDRPRALARLFDHYRALAGENQPVGGWEVPS